MSASRPAANCRPTIPAGARHLGALALGCLVVLTAPAAGSAAAGGAPPAAEAGGEVVLQVLGPHPPAPAWQQLAAHIRRRTSVPLAPACVGVAGDDEAAIFLGAALVWPDDVPAPALAAAGLRRYLEAGGSLWLDGGADHPGLGRVQAALGTTPLAPVAATHVLFKTFYLLDAGGARGGPMPAVAAGSGAELGGRLAVWASGSALAPSWERAPLATAGAAPAAEAALRLGVNWLMYTLCLDYKDDQVHLPYILRRRH